MSYPYNKMKVRDFIKMNADIDVYDDVCEALAIAFCGPAAMTEEGEKHFAEVLDYDIELDLTGSIKTAAVMIDGDDGDEWKGRFRKAKKFFYGLAGYCADEDYRKWFKNFDYDLLAPDGMVYMTIYCDTTPWYTEDEMNYDNMCDLAFPRKLVEAYYNQNCREESGSFVEWLTEVYDCDSTNDLFGFCMDRGFIAVRED